MIELLLPTTVTSFFSEPSLTYTTPYIEEVDSVKNAVEKRRAEFLTGRNCARESLQRLGLASTIIPIGKNRAPIWPTGVVGSITHCKRYCAAATALATDHVSIGIDAETKKPLPSGVKQLVLTKRELKQIAELENTAPWDTLIFSAKESLFKAWWPSTQYWLDFDEATICLNPSNGTFQAKIQLHDPTIENSFPSTVSGRFLISDELILTAVIVS